jgi:hypothetical protein
MLTSGGRKNVVTEEAVPGGERDGSQSVQVENVELGERRRGQL